MRRLPWLAVALAIPASARADEFSLHVTLASSVAGSDNAYSDPEGMVTGSDATLAYGLRPGALFSYHSYRWAHEIAIESGLDGVGFEADGITLTYRGAWRGTYSIGPRTESEAGAGVSGGRVNALTTTVAPQMGTGPTVLPTGNPKFFGADANEQISYLATPLLSLRQFGFGRYSRTNAPPLFSRGLEVGGGLGGDRTFKVTSIGLQAQASFQRLFIEDMDVTEVDRDQLDLRGTARVRRDFSRHWSGAIEGGAVTLYPLRSMDKLIVQPLGGLDVSYFPDWGSANLNVRHNVAPNLFLAQNEITDSATVTMQLPLPFLAESRANPRMTFLGSTGYGRTRFIDSATGDTTLTFDVIASDLALTYSPERNMTIAARYQFARQSSPDGAAVEDAFGYLRNTLMVTFYGRWPDRLAHEMPVRNRVRVRDLTPVGDETTRGIDGIGGNIDQR